MSDEVSETRPINTFRNGKVHVMRKACDACLLSPQRLVEPRTAADIVRKTTSEEGGNFVCHKGTIDGKDAICRKWFDKFADADPVLSMAKVMNVIEEVDK